MQHKNDVFQTILIIDDSTIILRIAERVLVDAGFATWTAHSGEEALSIISRKGMPHLVLVDLNMPGMGGFTFCKKLHSFSNTPIIIITSEESEDSIVRGLDNYAEDYIVKPLRSKELVSRVRRVLRRIGSFSYTFTPLTHVDETLQIDFPKRKAFVCNKEVSLTPTESRLLYILMRNAGRTVTNYSLAQRLWPLENANEERLHTHIYRLRKKIEEEPKKPRYVLSNWGNGYSFYKTDSKEKT